MLTSTILATFLVALLPTTYAQSYGDQYSAGNPSNEVPQISSPSLFLPQPLTGGANPIVVLNTAYAGVGGINIHFQTPYALQGQPTLKYGSSASSLTSTALGSSLSVNRVPACNSTNYQQCSANFHDIKISGLGSKTRIYYQIQNDASGVPLSQVYSVKTAIAAGDSTPFNATIYGDLGYTNAANTRLRLIESLPTQDFVFHVGDISYADDWARTLESENGGTNGGDETNDYETSWDIWQQWMNNITTQIPYHVMPGNHEITCLEGDSNHILGNGSFVTCPASQRNFTAFNHRFRMPSQESNAGLGTVGRNMWHSYDYGLVHFVAIDTNTDYPNAIYNTVSERTEKNAASKLTDSGPFGFAPPTGQQVGSSPQQWGQVQWLINDLASVDRSKTPWIVVGGHHPLYTSEDKYTNTNNQVFTTSYGGYNNGYSANLRATFEPIFLKYGVDLYFNGHVHWYERTYPIVNGTIIKTNVNNFNNYTATENAPVYITNGAAGNVEDHSADPNVAFEAATIDDSSYGVGRLSVYNSSYLYWAWYHASDGSKADDLYLVKTLNHTSKVTTTVSSVGGGLTSSTGSSDPLGSVPGSRTGATGAASLKSKLFNKLGF